MSEKPIQEDEAKTSRDMGQLAEQEVELGYGFEIPVASSESRLNVRFYGDGLTEHDLELLDLERAVVSAAIRMATANSHTFHTMAGRCPACKDKRAFEKAVDALLSATK